MALKILPTRSISTRKILLLTYEGAQILDMAGPASVFAETNEFTASPGYAVVVASPNGGVVSARGGMGLQTNPVLAQPARGIDTLLVSGGLGEPLRRVIGNQELAKWFQRAARSARRFGSTCTGAFVLAHWGLLDGRRATTHWQAAASLAAGFPRVHVDADALFVADGKVWTSAGVSTGIDMALAMVEHDLGRPIAIAVAKRLVLQTRRPGNQSQFSSLLKAQGGNYADLVQWIDDHLDEALSIAVLAHRAKQSERTFCRRFTQELGTTPAAFVEQLRLNRARTMLEAGSLAKVVAVQAGFGAPDRLWRAFQRAYGLSPSTYQALHAQAH
jgi:transcriptional regulator GlxA family with amidase domain